MRPSLPASNGMPDLVAWGRSLWIAYVLIPAFCMAQPLEREISAQPLIPSTTREIVPRNVVSMEIALGRLRLGASSYKIVKKHESFEDESCHRSIQVSSVEGRPTLRAIYNDPKEKWSIQFDMNVGVQWAREYTDSGVPIRIEYSQQPRQPIVIRLSHGSEATQSISQPTLWHFIEKNDLEFSKYVLPSLLRLNPCWDLRGTLETAKRYRNRLERMGESRDIVNLTQSVADLEASDQSVRAAAIEHLRRAGLSAYIMLEQFSRGELAPQQRRVIDQLLTGLEPRSADTPTRLAYWLSGDPNWR